MSSHILAYRILKQDRFKKVSTLKIKSKQDKKKLILKKVSHNINIEECDEEFRSYES